jgi:acyl carrier protein
MEVEKQLDIQIEDSAADEIQTVENLVDFIATKFN